MDALRDLAASWKDRAADLRAWAGADGAARAWECAAEELVRAVRLHQAEILTMAEAGAESGYAPDTIRKKIAAGELPNAGRPNAPRIRRGDLPRKAAPSTRTAPPGVLDIEAEARRIAGRR